MTHTLPPLDVLDAYEPDVTAVPTDPDRLARALAEHGAPSEHVATIVGPQVVSYRVKLSPGVKASRVARLADEVSLAMNAPVRYAGIVGDRVVFEVARETRAGVTLHEAVSQGRALVGLGFPLGRTVSGGVRVSSLAKLPHLIVAGTTGSGKSAFLHSVVTSLLLRHTPDELALHLIDPKRVELNVYAPAPHVASMTTDAYEASLVLKSAAAAMDARYEAMERAGVREISAWNDRAEGDRWKRVVIVVEELADLLMSSQSKQVEHHLERIAQLGRAAGIHLVVATQRPSAKVLPELLRANIPARVVFAVATPSDGLVALGRPGAVGLLGKGDGLFIAPGAGAAEPERFQSAFVSRDEAERVVAWWMQHAPSEEVAPDPAPRDVPVPDDSEGERLRASLASYAESARRVDPELVVPLSPEEKLAHLGLDDDEVLDYLAARVLERAATILESKENHDG